MIQNKDHLLIRGREWIPTLFLSSFPRQDQRGKGVIRNSFLYQIQFECLLVEEGSACEQMICCCNLGERKKKGKHKRC